MSRLSSLFSDAERAGGKPVELYTFRRGLETWLYTSHDAEQTVDGLTYTPADVVRGASEQKQDTPGLQITVTVSLDTPLGQALLVQGFQPLTCSIRRVQTAGDPVRLLLLGEMVACKFVANTAELTIATVEHRFKTTIPRILVQRTCPYALYSTSCGVDPSTRADVVTVTALASATGGSTVTISDTASAGFWVNGILQLADGRELFIVAQQNIMGGTVLSFWGALPSDLAVADSVTVYPGCDKLFATCESKFDNASNFGGFPNLPDRNASQSALR